LSIDQGQFLTDILFLAGLYAVFFVFCLIMWRRELANSHLRPNQHQHIFEKYGAPIAFSDWEETIEEVEPLVRLESKKRVASPSIQHM